jgi:hypothetical protein
MAGWGGGKVHLIGWQMGGVVEVEVSLSQDPAKLHLK